MTPAAALMNQAQLWVFCYSGLSNCLSDSDRHAAQWCLRTINDDRIKLKLALHDGDLSRRGSWLPPPFGTPRRFQTGLLFNTLPPALRRRSHQLIAREGPRSIARSE